MAFGFRGERARDEKARRAADAQVADAVPPGMRIAADWSWRILVVAGALALLGFLVVQLREVAVPFLLALVLSALLVPFSAWLQRHHWPKGFAVALSEVGVIAIIGGLVTLVVFQVRNAIPDLQHQTLEKYEELKQFLLDSPFHLTEKDISAGLDTIINAIKADAGSFLSGALSVGSTAGHLLTGTLLTLFATLFILIDGKRIWTWLVGVFPRRARPAVDGAGQAGWQTLSAFVRVQILVAFVDAVGIGLGAWILGLFFGGFPLVVPIAVAVFLGSFIPVVGAVVTGAIAVFVALVYLGIWPAVIMLGVVILVQQVEGHVLQPFIMGNAVKVHPLAVVLVVAVGGFVAGLPARCSRCRSRRCSTS